MSSLSPREELLQLQKQIYRHNREIISQSVIPEDKGFSNYERRYFRAVSSFKKVVTPDQMMEEALKADIIYVGDYHTLNQSQRSFLRFLRDFVKRTRNFAIGVEVISAEHQKYLDSYMMGKVSDRSFLKRIGFREHWFFDLWENFRPIFDFARYHHIPVYGIEGTYSEGRTLEQRDQETARLIFEKFQINPLTKFIAFVGDLHTAPKHLPREVERLFRISKIPLRTVTLYQNSDAIYWKLAGKELEHQATVVQISDNEFCRMHTPPIICQQSFLNWLEHEEGMLDYADAKETFLDYLDRITQFLGIKLGREKEEVEVFTCGDLSFLKRLRESKAFSPTEIREIKRQILRSESYYIPKKKFVYLADVSVNHAAEEAAHMVRHMAAGDEFPRPMQDAFYANILHEAIGFFGSKIINHRRKCFRSPDYLKLLLYLKQSHRVNARDLEYSTAVLFLEHEAKSRKGEPFHTNKIGPLSTDLFLSVTHAIAYELGEKMFHALLEGKLTKEFVRGLVTDPMAEEGETVSRYFDLLKRVKGVKLPRRG